MWKCFGCGRDLSIIEIQAVGLHCPYCGSDDVTRIEDGGPLSKEAADSGLGHFYSSKVQELHPYQGKSDNHLDGLVHGYGYKLIVDDPNVINSLLRCAVDWPTIFGLVWGNSGISFRCYAKRVYEACIQYSFCYVQKRGML